MNKLHSYMYCTRNINFQTKLQINSLGILYLIMQDLDIIIEEQFLFVLFSLIRPSLLAKYSTSNSIQRLNRKKWLAGSFCFCTFRTVSFLVHAVFLRVFQLDGIYISTICIIMCTKRKLLLYRNKRAWLVRGILLPHTQVWLVPATYV